MKIAINGFGRIGRTFFRAAFEKDLDIIAVNDIGGLKTIVHLLEYDSSYGKFPGKIELAESGFKIDGKEVKFLSEKEPANLPWKDLGIDIVVESTGIFTDYEGAQAHIKAGAKHVIITAPCKDNEKIKTVVLGVNEEELNLSDDVVSMASCTTNCLAPVAKVLHENFKIEKSSMTTIHSYTMDQRLQDDAHKDLRRARSATTSIIPTTTGATIAAAEVIPELKNKMNGISYRVPTQTVSLIDFVALLGKETDKDEVNAIFKKAAADPKYKGAIEASEKPLVSVDFKANPHAAVVDLLSTQVIDGNLVRVVAWYDNEMGYSIRLAEFCKYIEGKIGG